MKFGTFPFLRASKSQKEQYPGVKIFQNAVFCETLHLTVLAVHLLQLKIYSYYRHINELSQKLCRCLSISLNIWRTGKVHKKCEILGSQGYDYGDFCLSGCVSGRKFAIKATKIVNIYI
jgi:hypothetical protein